jgi:hypothetical protein
MSVSKTPPELLPVKKLQAKLQKCGLNASQKS